MADIFYIPPSQKAVECRYLERNYLSCIMQKAMKDRLTNPICDLQGVVYFHIECPSYIEKFDGPDAKSYIKRQVFSMLMLPYIQSKITASHMDFLRINMVHNKFANFKHIKYPEELDSQFNYEKTDVNNPDLFKKHAEFYTYNSNFMNMNTPFTDKLPGKLAEAEE
jgi:hypothetical protein